MSNGLALTEQQIETVNKTIEEQRMFGLTEHETLQLIQKRINRPLSRSKYYQLRQKVFNDNEVMTWITTFARVGYLDHYQQRIKELLYLNQELMKLFGDEVDRPNPNKHVVSSLARNIRENESLLLAAGLGSPVLLQMKQLIDKGGVAADKLLSGFDDKRHDNSDTELITNSGFNRNTIREDDNRLT